MHSRPCLGSAWRSGQDQAKALKLSLQGLVPRIKIYLDVDAALSRPTGDIFSISGMSWPLRSPLNSPPGSASLQDWMQQGVEQSTMLIALLTGGSSEKPGAPLVSHYFTSRACRSEIRKAMEANKRIVLLVETDEKHGGVPMSVHEELLRKQSTRSKSRRVPDADEADAQELYEFLFGPSKQVKPTSEGGRVQLIPWYRYAELQEVSMRLLVQSMVQAEARPRSEEATGTVYILGELDRQHCVLRKPSNGYPYHFVMSSANAGAAGFADWFQTYLHEAGLSSGQELSFAHIDSRTVEHTGYLLLYLNRTTWQDEDEVEEGASQEPQRLDERRTRPSSRLMRLVGDVTMALNLGLKMCIVHEMREQHGGLLAFDEIYKATPQMLRRRLYNDNVALPMTDGVPGCPSVAHERASVQILLRHLCPHRPVTDAILARLPTCWGRWGRWSCCDGPRSEVRVADVHAHNHLNFHNRMSELELEDRFSRMSELEGCSSSSGSSRISGSSLQLRLKKTQRKMQATGAFFQSQARPLRRFGEGSVMLHSQQEEAMEDGAGGLSAQQLDESSNAHAVSGLKGPSKYSPLHIIPTMMRLSQGWRSGRVSEQPTSRKNSVFGSVLDAQGGGRKDPARMQLPVVDQSLKPHWTPPESRRNDQAAPGALPLGTSANGAENGTGGQTSVFQNESRPSSSRKATLPTVCGVGNTADAATQVHMTFVSHEIANSAAASARAQPSIEAASRPTDKAVQAQRPFVCHSIR